MGVSTWISNGTALSVGGLLPSTVYLWQGAGFQLATLVAFCLVHLLVDAVSWQTFWQLVALAPLVSYLAASALFVRFRVPLFCVCVIFDETKLE